MLMYIFIIMQIIPALFYLYVGFSNPYKDLKQGDTLLTYIQKFDISPFFLAWAAFVTPIVNWIITILIIKEDFPNLFDDIFEALGKSFIARFIKEFFLAIKLLIVWMFGLKYICRFLKKILSVPIK